MGNDSSCNVIGSRRGSSCNKKKKRNKIRDKLTKKAQIHLGLCLFASLHIKKWENICKKNEEYGIVRMYMCEMFKRKGG